MSKLEYIDTVEMPEYILPYLINGDASGLSEEDVKACDDALARLNDDTGQVWRGLIFDYSEETLGFSWRPFFGLGANCYTCHIYGHREGAPC